MYRTPRPALSARAARDEGVALITVVGVIALVTILVIAGFALAQQAFHESNQVNRETQAFQAANAGLDAAVARIQYQGYSPTSGDFPMHLTAAQIGAGETTVTVRQISKSEYEVVSVGVGRDGTSETVRVRMYFIDLYSMNVSYGARLQASASGGKLNGTTSIYGPIYTFGDLVDLGTGSGGIKWGPLMVKGGNVVSRNDWIDVGTIYYEPPHTISVGVETTKVPSVPDFVVPPVDADYIAASRQRALAESSDNNQGEPVVRPGVTNFEVSTIGDPATYTHTRAPGASAAYKIVDNDGVNSTFPGSAGPGLLIDGSQSFGISTDDFAYDRTTGTLTVWGTVYIDGNFITTTPIVYVGNGMIVANGEIQLLADFKPKKALTPGLGGKNGNVTYNYQSFDPDETIGLVSPYRIICDNGGGNPGSDPETPPSHAGAFYSVNPDASAMGTNPGGTRYQYGTIEVGTKAAVVGSVITTGITFRDNNNQHLRTSANLGTYVPRSMPGYGMLFQSIGAWSRR